MKVCVLGAGAWGTALAMHVAKKTQTVLWGRDSGHISGLKKARSNPLYLGDFIFPDFLSVESNLSKALKGCDLILSVVPTSGFREILTKINQYNGHAPVIWANKGLEQSSAKLAHEIAAEELDESNRSWGVLSGPSFAAELVRSLPTAITLATNDSALAKKIAPIFHQSNLRIYTSTDVIGVSVAGALKNVIAIASGISDGMGFGNNARAALITRGLAEISRFGLKVGANIDTFSGLSGAGDLVLTCTGEFSRNREVGSRLAKGESLNYILERLGHVAEGVFTAKEVVNRSKVMGVDMPITDEVNNVLQYGKPPKEAVINLLERSIKNEF